MNKQIKWPLILIFAAFSFLSHSAFNEQPIKPWLETKKVPTDLGSCDLYYANDPTSLVSFSDCKSQAETTARAMGTAAQWDMGGITTQSFDYYGSPAFWVFLEVRNTSGGKVTAAKWVKQQSSTSEQCPPDGAPEYSVGPVPESTEKPNHMVCKPKFTPCPLGFYANAVASMPGQAEQCVPIQCPSKGQAVNNIKNLQGIIPAGQTGTYCDGLCNYSIQTGGISYQGQQFASGVSLGTQCGQSPISGQKFTPLDKEKSCTEHTLSSGAIFLECTEGTDEPAPDPNNPDLNLDAKKVDPQPTIDPFTGIECTTVEDKMSCVGKNVTDAITKQTKDEAKLAAERHNKLLEAQKEITEYVERQQRNREEARKNDAVTMVEAIQEVNRTLQTGGGGGGGTGTIVGLEGLVSAVEGIGEGVNETSVETDSEPSEGIQSFYEAEYPNGFQDVWQKNKAAFENTEMNQYLDSWKLTATGAAPPMQLCFNVIMDFGCAEFVIDPRVFPFLRIIMLVSTAFLCRALIFGG